MEKDGNLSSRPLIIRLDSPGIRSEGPTAPTPMQTIRGTGQKWKDLQTTSVVVTPTGFFPSAFVTMDTGDNDVINPGVHVHLKRPPFENCVRLFRSKLYEITKLPETSETPELPPSKQREWKEAIAHLIGLDPRKLNDCYKHDMRTAKYPREVWKEVDTLFKLWRKKEIVGQVKDTLKQTQFKIINAVPLSRRLELLKKLNKLKLSWPDFLDLCKEDVRPYQNNSSVASQDTKEVTCTSDPEEEVFVVKPPANVVNSTKAVKPTSNDPTSKLGGQVEDLFSRVKVFKKKWLEAEKGSDDNESVVRELTKTLTAERSMIIKLKFALSRQQEKNWELIKRAKLSEKEVEESKIQIRKLQQQLRVLSSQDSHQGGSMESLERQNKIHAEELRLKSLELAAKDKEIEMIKVQKSSQLCNCKAELAFKSALLEAREREIELQRLKAEHNDIQNSSAYKQEGATLPFSAKINCAQKAAHSHGSQERPTCTDTPGRSPPGYKQIEVDDTDMNQLCDVDGTDKSAGTEFWENLREDTELSPSESPYPVSVKRIKIEPQD